MMQKLTSAKKTRETAVVAVTKEQFDRLAQNIVKHRDNDSRMEHFEAGLHSTLFLYGQKDYTWRHLSKHE